MPLTKQYLTYAAECRYGVVTGRKGGAVLVRGEGGRPWAVSPALEDVKFWDIRTSTMVKELKGNEVEVGVVCVDDSGHVLASGLENGSIMMWDMAKNTSTVTLSGHKSAVTCLQFNSTHTQLVSGSKDTHVIVWDLVAESGLYRLKGHKGAITDCRFLSMLNVIITCSKDGLVKLWDLDTQHCFHTIVSHHREVWSIELVGGASGGMASSLPRLVTASGDSELRVFKLAQGEIEDKVPVVVTEMGVIKMPAQHKLMLVSADSAGSYLACLCPFGGVELYSVRTAAQIEKTVKKRKRKALKSENEGDAESITVKAGDELRVVCTIKGSGKHRSVHLLNQSQDKLLVLLTMQNNCLEVHEVVEGSPRKLYEVSSPGHGTDIRTVCFSSDNTRILSGSAKSVKVWHRDTQQCVCTMTSRYALSSTFVPGDRHAIIGTKSGYLQLFDLSANALLEEIPAHQGAVWGVALYPDKRGVTTGGADHTVKFWEFELASVQDSGKKLTLVPTRTLKLSEDVLGVCHSPNGRLLAVSLLDSTIKIFFTDTLKYFLSLYGHKLPVLAMDISTDSSLLVSCSADKNIRIWGLDFGDCHKSIFAHDESVMCVKFVADTHLLFSAGKDALLKCWDADNFQHVLTLKGHQNEVWCLAISSDGDTVVSGSHDLSLRLWHRTRDPLVLSEQRELEREGFMDQLSGADTGDHVIPGEVPSEVSLPLARSRDTLSVVDRLLEAIMIWKEEEAKEIEYQSACEAAGRELVPPKPHLMLVAHGNIKAEKYVLNVLKSIRSSELEESLLVMPFDQVIHLLTLTDVWLQNCWEVELVCRCLFFLLRVHHPQLVTSHTLLPILHSLSHHTSTRIGSLKDMCGFNLAGLEFIRRELESRGTGLFKDAPMMVRKKRKIAS